jgi:hypothetical protein
VDVRATLLLLPLGQPPPQEPPDVDAWARELLLAHPPPPQEPPEVDAWARELLLAHPPPPSPPLTVAFLETEELLARGTATVPVTVAVLTML